MTKDARFKKVVRRHAQDTGQRYTASRADLEGLPDRIAHRPTAKRLLAHLRDHHDVDATAAVQLSQHNDHVFGIDRDDGDPWVARVFPPARPPEGVEGDAEVLRFLEAEDYPAERTVGGRAVSTLDGSSVLLTAHVAGELLPSPAAGPQGIEKFAILGDLLGRLHALEPGDAVTRPGGASGEDPDREGTPRQDLLAGLALLDSVDVRVSGEVRPRFDALRDQVRAADAGEGLPEALVHGNLMHAPDHVVLGPDGPVAIQWKSSGIGPRLHDVAYLLWGTWLDASWIEAAVGAYQQHVELTDDELDRFEGVMQVRPLYLACFDWHRTLAGGGQPSPADPWWAEPDPDYISSAAAAAVAAFRRAR